MDNLLEHNVITKILHLFRMSFENWNAFRMGIIDENGDILKETKETNERKAFGLFEKFVWKEKFILEHFNSYLKYPLFIKGFHVLNNNTIATGVVKELMVLDEGLRKYVMILNSNKNLFNRILENVFPKGHYKFKEDDPEGNYKIGDEITIKDDVSIFQTIVGLELYKTNYKGKDIVFIKNILKKIKE